MSLLKRIEQGQAQQGGLPRDSSADGPNTSRLANIKREKPPGMSPGARDTYYDLKSRVQNKLLSELDPSMDVTQTAEVRKTIEDLFENILTEEKIVLSRPERRRLFEQIVAEILGLGPLEPLLADESITEVMVNGAKNIYIERKGKIFREPVGFESDDHLMRIIDRIVAPLGRRIDESSPYVDARLPDGSRVNAVIPPISSGRPDADDPKVRQDTDHGRAADRVRHHHGRVDRVPQGVRSRPHQYGHLGRYGLRQDHDAQRAVTVHTVRRAHHHDRECRRAPAQAGARRNPGITPAEH